MPTTTVCASSRFVVRRTGGAGAWPPTRSSKDSLVSFGPFEPFEPFENANDPNDPNGSNDSNDLECHSESQLRHPRLISDRRIRRRLAVEHAHFLRRVR